MNPRLSPSDAESVANLAEIRQINNVTAQVLYDFLNEMPRAITPELMRDANPDGNGFSCNFGGTVRFDGPKSNERLSASRRETLKCGRIQGERVLQRDSDS